MATVFPKTIAKQSLEEIKTKLLHKIKAKGSVDALVVHNSKEELKLQRWRVGRDSKSVNWIHNPNKIGFYKCKQFDVRVGSFRSSRFWDLR